MLLLTIQIYYANKDSVPEVEVSLSEVVYRNDDTKAKQTVCKVNALLADNCTATNLNLMHNS